nr:hypothetical protein [Nanoarchaeum sp.]
MIYVNQLTLTRYSVRQNKEFLESMFSGSFRDVSKWFDSLSCKSLRRELDTDMNLETFIRIMNKQSVVKLQLASPDPNIILYNVITPYRDYESVFFLKCLYNSENFDILFRIYQHVFKIRLEDEPVKEGVLSYYKWRINSDKM